MDNITHRNYMRYNITHRNYIQINKISWYMAYMDSYRAHISPNTGVLRSYTGVLYSSASYIINLKRI